MSFEGWNCLEIVTFMNNFYGVVLLMHVNKKHKPFQSHQKMSDIKNLNHYFNIDIISQIKSNYQTLLFDALNVFYFKVMSGCLFFFISVFAAHL